MGADRTPAAGPPIVDPESFHDFDGFRETTLSLFTRPEDNAALRHTGRLLYTLACEVSACWPAEPEGNPRHECRAAVADLRHMQGFLGMLGREVECSREGHEGHLARVCNRLSAKVQEVADVLDKELGEWRGEE